MKIFYLILIGKYFVRLAEKTGCFIMGRKTYEEVKKWKNYNLDDVKSKKIIVTKNQKFKLNYGIVQLHYKMKN